MKHNPYIPYIIFFLFLVLFYICYQQSILISNDYVISPSTSSSSCDSCESFTPPPWDTSIAYQRGSNEPYNTLKYPFKPNLLLSEYPQQYPTWYNQPNMPNLALPANVIGCGARNEPCLGGTEIPILNPPVPIIINEDNIAPNNITYNDEQITNQIGVIYKIFDKENIVLPLLENTQLNYSNEFKYFTIINNNNIPIIRKNSQFAIGTNDVVYIQGNKTPYRTTIYDN